MRSIKTWSKAASWLALALVLLVPAGGAPKPSVPPKPVAAKALKSFQSDAELKAFIKKLPPGRSFDSGAFVGGGCGEDEVGCLETVAVTGMRASPGITNTQEAGVDEGDIVKLSGNFLVVLRRGRIFTVSIAGGLKPVDSINAFAPGVNAKDDWYDEMLVAGGRVVVIGYSYGRGGTEINRFDLDRNGHLKYLDTYHLRSNDYYSSRNYASRLIGNELILYAPLYLPQQNQDALMSLPALRRWTGNPEAGFERLSAARQVFVSPAIPDELEEAVHNVVRCDVSRPVMACKATSVIGPAGRVFYVSESAIYLWATPDWWSRHKGLKHPASFLFRLPFDGSAPTAIGTRGAPIDQFSFREERPRGLLTVLVTRDGDGEGMWLAEKKASPVALAYIDLAAMGDGSQELDLSHYRPLVIPEGKKVDDFSWHNRFVGQYLLYGMGRDWGRPQDQGTVLVTVPVHRKPVTTLRLPHMVDRIEVMGDAGVVVGSSASDLHFTAVELGAAPSLGDSYVLKSASEAETRSHGFFFNPAPNGRDGVLGLPVAEAARPAYRQLFDGSASVMFLRRMKGKFLPLGKLEADQSIAVDDHCLASCVDWYGNARPIFIDRRSFALMGYELIEGEIKPDSIREIGRSNFAPKKAE